MSRLAHVYEPGMTYLITAVTHGCEAIFEDADCAQVALDDIAFYAHKFQAASLAYVVMPDHIHWVIYPLPGDFERFSREQQENDGKYAGAPDRFYLSKIMEDYKRHTSFVINGLRATRGQQVRQDGFRDDELRTPDAVRAAVQYVLNNPVEAGLVENAANYPFLAWDAAWLA